MRRRAWALMMGLGLASAGCGSDDDGRPAAGLEPDQPTGRLVILSAPGTSPNSMLSIDVATGERTVLTARPGPDEVALDGGSIRPLVAEEGHQMVLAWGGG